MRELDVSTRRLLDHIVARLAAEYDGVFEPRTVERLVEDSVDRLGQVTVSRFVPLLTERFARERLLAAAQHAGLLPIERPQLLFVCTHNAGRSQMARLRAARLGGARRRALGRLGPRCNDRTRRHRRDGGASDRDGIRVPQALTDEVVRAADVVVTMGCGDACPVLPGTRYLDWHITDSAGRHIDAVRAIRGEIADRMLELLKDILP